MKYLVIEDKHVEVKTALQLVRKYHPSTKYPRFKKRKPQFFFPKNDLKKEEVADVANELGMQVVKMTRDRATIGNF